MEPQRDYTSIASKLDEARKELLDLGLRNPLISFRRLKARGVQIVDEHPGELYRILVREGKTMYFDPLPEGEADEDDIEFEQPEREDNDARERYTDNRLQTPHTSQKLQKRLLNTYYSAGTFIEEQGINVLYLALGMLEWYESPSSEKKRVAPLVLIPVGLSRASVESKFKLFYTGEEIVTNLSLQAKLKLEFEISIPDLPAESDDIQPVSYFAEVGEKVAHLRRWSVDTSAVELGFFSFGKFLMYNDLDVRKWPESHDPGGHRVLKALLEDGFPQAEGRLPDEAHLDETLRPADVNHIVDADSTQILALVDALQGHNLVIQGPPGTGKSQTITNLIAEALANGKKILFVSEKMAALEVVKRRLDSLGLGDACLELHSYKTNKKALIDELARTLQLGRPKERETDGVFTLLESTRARLNEYADAVNHPIRNSGLTPYQVYGRLLPFQNGKKIQWPVLENEEMADWSAGRFAEVRALADKLQAQLSTMGHPKKHPFYGCKCAAVTPAERQSISTNASAALRLSTAVREKALSLARETNLPEPESLQELVVLLSALRRAMSAPPLEGAELDPDVWQRRGKLVDDFLQEIERYQELRREHDETLIPDAWNQSVLGIRQQLAAHGPKWYRLFIGDYRRARTQLTGLCREGLPPELDKQLALADAILETQRLRERIREADATASSLFGVQWEGPDSDVNILRTIADWIRATHSDVAKSKLPMQLLDLLQANRDLSRFEVVIDELEERRIKLSELLDGIARTLRLDSVARFGSNDPFGVQSFKAQESLLWASASSLDRLQEIVAYNNLVAAAREERVTFLEEVAETWDSAPDLLVKSLEYNWYNDLLRVALSERRALNGFDGARQMKEVELFRQLDKTTFDLNRAALARQHWEELPRGMAGQMGVLRHEFHKKRRHLPIRQIIGQAGAALQAIKPVFMMSPMSIAAYVPPGSVEFDIVVFDEASQVKPVEAFGAIIRGKQTVVVGDDKQLPPTSFFDSVAGDSVIDTEDEDLMAAADVESVLGLFNAKGAPDRMLRWHYRSRHDSLITVSNREFYDGRLVSFPSPLNDGKELGLRYHHLPDTSYERGGSRANRGEAQAVVEAVMRHAKTRPDLTLGVAAFSQAQAEAIQNQLEVARRQDPSCEPFFSAHQNEPFFVKNLENVQGDERDIILISIGYGRDENGKLTMNFGPLNRDGGERRLNVLITRARRRCEVFTNLLPEDINLTQTNARGVVALRRYLNFARTGELDIPEPTGRDADSVFEEQVAKAIRSFGYEVHHQIGSAGYFVDLAVVDPERPGRYLLGMECDGATYHSARSARDRDRIRQSVLEGLGWNLHRIWSTDWFQNPPREAKRVLEAIEAAKAARPTDTQTAVVQLPTKKPVIERESEPVEVDHVRQSTAYKTASLPKRNANPDGLHMENPERLATMLRDVVQVESPVHFEEACRRLLDAFSITRLGKRIRERMSLAASMAERRGWLRKEGDFLFDPAQKQIPIRDRSDFDQSSKKMQLVAPAEIRAAAMQIVQHSIGISREDLASEICSILGFARTTSDMRDIVNVEISHLVNENRLGEQDGQLTVV